MIAQLVATFVVAGRAVNAPAQSFDFSADNASQSAQRARTRTVETPCPFALLEPESSESSCENHRLRRKGRRKGAVQIPIFGDLSDLLAADEKLCMLDRKRIDHEVACSGPSATVFPGSERINLGCGPLRE